MASFPLWESQPVQRSRTRYTVMLDDTRACALLPGTMRAVTPTGRGRPIQTNELATGLTACSVCRFRTVSVRSAWRLNPRTDVVLMSCRLACAATLRTPLVGPCFWPRYTVDAVLVQSSSRHEIVLLGRGRGVGIASGTVAGDTCYCTGLLVVVRKTPSSVIPRDSVFQVTWTVTGRFFASSLDRWYNSRPSYRYCSPVRV